MFFNWFINNSKTRFSRITFKETVYQEYFCIFTVHRRDQKLCNNFVCSQSNFTIMLNKQIFKKQIRNLIHQQLCIF